MYNHFRLISLLNLNQLCSIWSFDPMDEVLVLLEAFSHELKNHFVLPSSFLIPLKDDFSHL